MSEAIAAVVFDLDGVLVDSESVWDAARREVVARNGGRWQADATRAMMGMSSPEWSRYLHDELGVPLEPEQNSWSPRCVPDRLRVDEHSVEVKHDRGNRFPRKFVLIF